MHSSQVEPLDAEAIDFFSAKGTKSPRQANPNGLKVRRVMQVISDLSRKPWNDLSVLDLACGEGVYAIEAALRGAHVTAIDGRTNRMDDGARIAAHHGIENVVFSQGDVRSVNVKSHGSPDVILFLGILYHLSAEEVFTVLPNLYEMCSQCLIIDTHIALEPDTEAFMNDRCYQGWNYQEHERDDSAQAKRAKLQASLDTPFSFWFTKDSLFRLLSDIGFSSVLEVSIPREPLKPENRITLVALKGEPVDAFVYPWVNGKTEAELEEAISGSDDPRSAGARSQRAPRSGSPLNRVLRLAGWELQRIR